MRLPELDDEPAEVPAAPTVYDDEPNPVIGVLLDHRGEVMTQVRQRPVTAMGFGR